MEDKETRDWSEALPSVEFGIRTTKQKTTNYSPYEIIFGRKPNVNITQTKVIENKDVEGTYSERLRGSLEKIHEKVRLNMEIRNKGVQARYDKNRWSKEVVVGDKVLVKNEDQRGFDKKYVGPYTVEKVVDKWTYVLYCPVLRKRIRRNYNQIKWIRKPISNTTFHTSILTKPEKIRAPSRRYPVRATRNPNPRYF